MIFSSNVNKRLQKLLLCGTAAVSLITIHTIAFAESGSVYVLQLGSFDSKEQAEQKWQDLKSKNPDALNKLSLHVSEISMAGDNKVTYRTQAGPVESHAKASEICGKLFEQGNECYVVETAMFAQEPMPENTSSSAPEVKPEEAGKVTTVYTPPQQQAATSVQLSQGDQTVPGRGPQFLDAASKSQEQATAPAESAASQQAQAAAPANRAAAQLETREPADNEEDYDSPAAERNSNSFLFGRAPKHHATVVQTATEEQPAPAPEPTPVPASKPGFFSSLFGSSKPAPTPAPVTVAPTEPVAMAPVQEAPAPVAETVVGNVSVAEAIRVPLTRDNNNPPPQHIVAVPPPGTPLMNMPAPDSNGVFWAQINYFADEAAAHEFYEEFRNAYPDISDGIRMRITRPYAYANNRGRVTLRMGTFALASDIRAICAMASHQDLTCVSVRDASPLGAGASYQNSRNAETPSNAFPTVSASSSGGHFLDAPQHVDTVAYWIQFGSFGSYDDAMDKWKDVQKSNKKLLSKLRPSISEPDMSSYERKVFRLRTGPFNNRGIADSLCDKLSVRGESCIVLGENPLFN